MSRPKILFLCALLAGGLVLAWLLLGGGDETRLRRTLNELAEQMSKGDSESLIASAARAERIAARFAERDVRICVEGAPDFSGPRDDVKAAVFQARSQVQKLHVSILDLQTEITPDGVRATQRFTAHAWADSPTAEDHAIREVRMDWVKSDGEWLIQSIEASEGLKRIP